MYSANQVRQLYVVDGTNTLTLDKMNSVDHAGKKVISLMYHNARLNEDQLVDYIEDSDIRIAKASQAPQLAPRTATLNIGAVPAHAATSPFEAYMTIVVPGFYGDTLENREVFPVGVQLAVNSTAANVATALANEITNNKTLNKHFTATASSNTLTITEKIDPTDARLGVYKLYSAPFLVENCHYVDPGEQNHLIDAYTPDLLASAVTYGIDTTNAISSAYELAQLEWFCHGFRGDVYRQKAFPNDYEFHPLVDTSINTYWTCDVHYFWHGYGNQVDKSEKVLTFIGSQTDMEALATALTNGATTSHAVYNTPATNN